MYFITFNYIIILIDYSCKTLLDIKYRFKLKCNI